MTAREVSGTLLGLEPTLSEVNGRWLRCYDAIQEPIALLSPNGAIRFLNRQARALLGLGDKEAIPAPLPGVPPWSTALRLVPTVRPGSASLEEVAVDPFGRTWNIRVSAIYPPLEDEHTVLVEIADKTDALELERSAREQDRRLELALGGARLGFWEWSLPAGSVKLDERAASLLGFAVHEIADSGAWDRLVHPDDRERVAREHEALRGGLGVLRELQYRLRSRSGGWCWVSESARVETGPTGQPSRVVGVLVDVTTSKKAEIEARESERRQRELFEVNPYPMWVYDAETLRVLDANTAALKQYGYERDAFLALTLDDIRVAQAMSGDITLIRHRKQNGEYFAVEVNTRELLWRGRAATLVLALDVTARRRSERLYVTLFRISEVARTASDLHDLFAKIHRLLRSLTYARNFYVAFRVPGGGLEFPYFADERDSAPPELRPGRTLTEYVIRTGEPLLADPDTFADLVRRGEVELFGADSIDWLGVPLWSGETVRGAIVVQSYDPAKRLTANDRHLLSFVAGHVGAVLERRRAESRERSRAQILERLAKAAPLAEVLEGVANAFERENEGARCAICLVDPVGRHLHLGAAPSLPECLACAADGVPCVDGARSCGTAIARRERVIVEDALVHPYWAPWRKLVERAGFRACWSEPVFSSSGEVLGSFSVYRDKPGSPEPGEITWIEMGRGLVSVALERHRAAAALAENELRFRTIADAAPVLIWMSDAEGKLTYFNRVWLDFTGRTPEEEVGEGWIEDVHPEDVTPWLEAMRGAVSGGSGFQIECRLKRNDSEYRWLAVNAAPRLSGGQVLGLIGACTDVTARKSVASRLQETSERLTTLVQALPEPVVLKDGAGRWLLANHAALERFGLQDVDWQGRTDDQLATLLPTGEDLRGLRHNDDRAWQAGQRLDSVDLLSDRSGVPFFLEASRVPVLGPEGRREGLVYLARTATESRRASEALLFTDAVFEQSREAVLLTDPEKRILRVNRAFSEVTGYLPEEVLGQSPKVLSSGRHGSDFYEAMWQCIKTQGRWQGEVWNRRKGGELYPEWLSISEIRDDGGSLWGYVGSFTDIAERKQIEEERRRWVFEDPVTSLANRLFAEQDLRLALAQPDGESVTLAVLDLDRFERISNTLGFETGDFVLRTIADRLRTAVSGRGLLGRWYGDQFSLTLRGFPSAELPDLLKEISRSISAAIVAGPRTVHVSACIGVAVSPGDGRDPVSLIQNAEQALRAAKGAGPGSCRFHQAEMDVLLHQQLQLEEELHQALEGDQFVLIYQPQVEVDSGHVTGVEALVRWNHPQRGMILPSEFIKLAEGTGAIVRLGKVVLAKACQQLASWRQSGFALRRVAVNVSARQLVQPDFISVVLETLERAHLAPADLDLEITESSLMEQSSETLQLLARLRELGSRISVDDFGTGFSALGYLRNLPVTSVKLDQSFVFGLPGDRSCVAITRAILSMAQSLGLVVVAEGVETQAQARFLALHGCHELQGYLYGRGVPAEELPALLRRLES